MAAADSDWPVELDIAGHVVDETGRPIAYARLSALAVHARDPIPLEAFADREGHFVFIAVERYYYAVQAASPDARFRNPRLAEMVVRAGTMDVSLVIPSGTTITGRALLDGVPMPRFGVTLTHSGDLFVGGRQAVSASDGRFTLANVEPGTWDLTLAGPGTQRKRLESIAIVSGGPIDVGDVVMEPGQRVAGHVLDRSGSPVEGARVIIGRTPGFRTAPMELDRWFHGPYLTATDETGAFVFDGVDVRSEAAGPHVLWAMHPTHGISVFREVEGVDSDFELELLGSATIVGVVEGLRGGTPLVYAKRSDEPEGVRRQVAWPNDAAEFRFEDVPPGEYVLSLDVPARVQTTPVAVTVTDGQEVAVTLTVVTSGVCLVVKVPEGRGFDLVLASDESGTPEPDPPRARIVVQKTSFSTRGTVWVRFVYLQPGRYRASIDGTSWTSIVVASAPSEQRVEVSS